MAHSVLFVCLGNICRSPTAEAVFRSLADANGLTVTVESAGTGDWHVGNPPHRPAIEAGRKRGYDLAPLRARQVMRADFERFDLILAMDEANRLTLERMRPPGNATPVELFLNHAPELPVREVPDPYYTGGFEPVLDMIEMASRGLIARLRA